MTAERILLAQLADIGDLTLATPALAALRAAKPKAAIDLLAPDHAIPALPAGLIDQVFPFQKGEHSGSRALLKPANLRMLLRLRRERYDAVVFFHHFTLKAGVFKFRLIARAAGARRVIGLKNQHAAFLTEHIPDLGFGVKHEAQYWLDLVALLGASNLPRPALARMEACDLLPGGAASQPRIVIHAGSGGYSRARRWLPARFAQVARQLHDRFDARIILVGTAADDSAELARLLDVPALDLTGQTSLPQLAHVISRSDLFIGADSGVMHIAAASGTPVLSIFGPSNLHAWHPWAPGGRAIALTSGVECSPCSYVGHGIGARDGCPARTCMKLISARQVVDAASQLLEEGDDSTASMPPPGKGATPSPIRVLGVPIHSISYESWLTQIGSWISQATTARHVCTVNPEFIMIARRDPIFFGILSRADLCLADGVGLLWACRVLKLPRPQRVTGSDGVPLIAGRAAQQGWRIFFLGAAAGVAERAADALRADHPALQVAGTHAGSPSAAEEDEIVALINGSRADILLVAYGAPKQDKWIARNLPRLEVKMAMGIGGALDFIAGDVARAPGWMRRRGLEWLYRLLRQPWRIRRMLRLPRFALAVLRERPR